MIPIDFDYVVYFRDTILQNIVIMYKRLSKYVMRSYFELLDKYFFECIQRTFDANFIIIKNILF